MAEISRRGFLVASSGAVLAGLVAGGTRPAVARAAGVPTFASLNGFALGERQATAQQLDDYTSALAAASDRVRTDLLHPSTVRGQALRYAVVSHPDNLAQLSTIAAKTRRLRSKPVGAAAVAAHARDEPAFAIVLANVHGNEPSGGDAVAQLLYDLASRDDAANLARLRALVFVLMAVQNPDGRNATRRVNANDFDLNRDWFAFTQPETRGKISLYSDFPPILGMDLHEQFLSAPDTFYFPPANDPVHHEASRPGIAASDGFITPAIEKAFTAQQFSWEHRGIYDLFYPGYGDVAPNLAWGAAGILFEPENNQLFPRKVLRQFTALDATVDAVAANKELLLREWGGQWAEARRQGLAGELAPNLRYNPANPAARAVPDEKIYGYALRTTSHAADVAHLVDRLRAFDVEVHVMRRKARLSRLRPFGASEFGPATLGRGTIVVTAGQPLKHWVHILLADEPHPALDYYYDVAGWSNPAMMGLSGGMIGQPLTPLLKRPKAKRGGKPRLATLRAIDAAVSTYVAPRRGDAYAFKLDAALAQAAAFALVKDGVALERLPDGSAVAPASSRSAVLAAAKRYGLRVSAAPAAGSDATPVVRPKVALMRDAGSELSSVLFATSAGFALWLLRDRFGLDFTLLETSDVEAGKLASDGYDVVVVPDGLATVVPAGLLPNVQLSPPGGGLTPVGLANLRSFVSGGGTYLGWRAQGVSVAVAAGIAGSLATKPAPSGFTVPGGPVRIELRGDDVATRGLGSEAYAFNVTDPILTGGGTTIARYPDQLRALAFAEGLEAVNGTVAGTRVAVGKGRSYVFSFDPCYRGFVEGTQRILGSILLSAPDGSAGASARSVDPARAATLTMPLRHHTVRVAAADAAALRAAAAGAPSEAAWRTLEDGSLELRSVDHDPLSGHPAAWMRTLTSELVRRGVRPSLIVA